MKSLGYRDLDPEIVDGVLKDVEIKEQNKLYFVEFCKMFIAMKVSGEESIQRYLSSKG
jgi:hypothetical protein